MSKNFFLNAKRRFSNQTSCLVEIVRIHSKPVSNTLQSISSLFKIIDFTDDYQRQLGRLVWNIRCKILFSLSPFDNEELGLLADVDLLTKMANGLPFMEELATQLKHRLIELIGQKENLKREWILNQNDPDDEPKAIFALMAMRKSFGADLISSRLLDKKINVISSLQQLADSHYSTLVIPGTLQYLSENLIIKLFYQGEFKRLRVLLYEDESLKLKSRIKLPESSLFPGLSPGIKISLEKISAVSLTHATSYGEYTINPVEISDIQPELLKDVLDNSIFWFLLFDDGSGFYANAKEKLRVWRKDSMDKLIFIYPPQLLEGDYVVLEESNRKALLEHTEKNSNFLTELDVTNVWKEPLQAMLLTVSPEEVADQMIATGHLRKFYLDMHLSNNDFALNNAARKIKINISKWANGQVFGPGDLDHLHALIQVLVDEKFLDIDLTPQHAAQQWFAHLEAIRSKRRFAGAELSANNDSLIESFFKTHTNITDGREFILENGMLISIHRLAIISPQKTEVADIFSN